MNMTSSGLQFKVAYWPAMTLGGAAQVSAARCPNERTLDLAVCSYNRPNYAPASRTIVLWEGIQQQLTSWQFPAWATGPPVELTCMKRLTLSLAHKELICNKPLSATDLLLLIYLPRRDRRLSWPEHHALYFYYYYYYLLLFFLYMYNNFFKLLFLHRRPVHWAVWLLW